MSRRLPKGLREVVAVIGRTQALRLVAATPVQDQKCPRRGWTQPRRFVYVPASLPVDHTLVRVLGYPDAVRMVQAFRGMILQLPSCRSLITSHRDDSIWRLHSEGATDEELARTFRLTTRQVRNIVKG